jgi:PKD repeat protein
MLKRKASLFRWMHILLIVVAAFGLITLFSNCEKDPIKGWAFFLEPAPPPEITAITSVIKNCEPPYPVTFKAEIKNVIGTIVYNWDFGDTIMNDSMPTHIYTVKGVYKVKLTISNLVGTDTSSIYISELNQSSLPVTAKFSWAHFNNNNYAPNKIIFTNQSTGANLFYWYFGDGGQSNEADPKYVFNSPGNYTIKLRGTCTNGSYNEYTQQVYITSAPRRIFIDAINLMLPSDFKKEDIFIDIYHNSTYIGSTVTKSPSSFPVKFIAPNGFTNNCFFDYVQYTSNEVFKFLICRPIPDNPPQILYEILLSSVDIKNNFYPTTYYQIETVPALKDVFIDLYLSY